MPWTRPESVEYPKEWLRFESDKKVYGGVKEKFVVKDLTPEYLDICLGYMTNMFLKESAICKPLNIIEDEMARRQMQETWLNIMNSKMAIICISEGPLQRVAGIHMTMVRERVKKINNKESSEKFSKFSAVVEELKNEGQLFERFGVDHYLGSLGLFVLPEFRGRGIAQKMLKAREIMCRSFGLKGTATVFSTAAAQAAASRAGYKTIATRTIEELARHRFTLDHDLKVMGMEIP